MQLRSTLELATLALAGTAAARSCQNVTVPVAVTSRNAIFGNIATPLTNEDAALFVLNNTRQGGNFSDQALTGYYTLNKNYEISAQICKPDHQTGAIQVLTHGIGFDKGYWDLSYNDFNYSYVNSVLAAGYATLAYDRLGIGLSSHGEPRDEIQLFPELEALAALTRLLRQGKFPGSEGEVFSKVIHVGHSYGSAQSYALANKYPELSDGIVLTGFSMNASFVPLFAAAADFQQAYLNQPLRLGAGQTSVDQVKKIAQEAMNDLGAPLDFALSISAAPFPPGSAPLNYSKGYLTNANINGLIYLFLLPRHFDLRLGYLGEATKQPVAPGEILTLGSLPKVNAFSKPVLVFTGSNDVPYCGGDCLATGDPSIPSIPSTVKKNFPNSGQFQAYIQPNTAHGITLHYNATAGYQYIQSWLASNGLAP